MMCSCSSGILVTQSMDIVNTADKGNEILKHNEITVCKEVSAKNHTISSHNESPEAK